MNNQQVLIIVLIVLLVIFKLSYSSENFDCANDFPCDKYPFNSNCTCPTGTSVQRVLGTFPMNYGQTAPYVYRCIPNSTPEPPTNVWPNPPE